MSSAAAVVPPPIGPRVPSELLDLAQWCLWRFDEGRKRPMALKGYWGSSTNPATWGEYGEAVEAMEKFRNAEGLGFVFTADDPYTGVDLDDCLDDAGRLKLWAVEILRRFSGTYAEISPSGTGIKIWCRGKIDASKTFKYEDGAIEIFSHARFFCVTGHLWPGSLLEIDDCQESIDWLLTLNPAGAKKAPFVLPEKIKKGSQHTTLKRLAGKLRGAGFEEAELAEALIIASRRCEDIPPESDMLTMAKSFRKLYPAGPSTDFNPQAEGAFQPDAQEPEPDTWPRPLDPSALIGIAGDVVRLIEPTTESDPAAILFQFLGMFGSIVGRGPHWIVEDTQHFTNLFVSIVGDTAKARKGTGYDRVRKVFEGMEPEWDERVKSGLSTGEGLIWAVRDPVLEMVAIKEKGKPTTYEEQMVDPGIDDKRLLVIEPEFARVLSAGQRQGNTLTAVMREAWDGKPVGIMTKTKTASCKVPHVSIISHITKEELLRCLTDTETANGYANRFLFVCARRSKILPFGGERIDWAETRVGLQSAINNARRTTELPFDSEAREIWAVAYEQLSAAGGGLYGSVTARAESQTRRLACLYALLDESPYIRATHLLAGLEAWRYCADSCRSIFGDTMGDPTADAILILLRRTPDGITRTELFQHFQKHKKSEEIGRALHVIQKAGKASSTREETAGRPTERWYAV